MVTLPIPLEGEMLIPAPAIISLTPVPALVITISLDPLVVTLIPALPATTFKFPTKEFND